MKATYIVTSGRYGGWEIMALDFESGVYLAEGTFKSRSIALRACELLNADE